MIHTLNEKFTRSKRNPWWKHNHVLKDLIPRAMLMYRVQTQTMQIYLQKDAQLHKLPAWLLRFVFESMCNKKLNDEMQPYLVLTIWNPGMTGARNIKLQKPNDERQCTPCNPSALCTKGSCDSVLPCAYCTQRSLIVSFGKMILGFLM